MKQFLWAFVLVFLCSTYLYAEEVQPNPSTEQLQPSQKAEEVQPNPNMAQPQPIQQVEEVRPRPKFASFLFSLSGGGFFPMGDYSGFNNDFDGTLTLGVTLGSLFGFGVDISYEKTDLNASYSNNQTANTVQTVGVEYLFYLEPNHWIVQPYIAAGFGMYFNNLDNLSGLMTDAQEYTLQNGGSGIGFGVVGKAGVRFFIGDHFFLGIYGKYYTDWQSVNIDYIGSGYSFSGNSQTINLGGVVANFEIGGKF